MSFLILLVIVLAHGTISLLGVIDGCTLARVGFSLHSPKRDRAPLNIAGHVANVTTEYARNHAE